MKLPMGSIDKSTQSLFRKRTTTLRIWRRSFSFGVVTSISASKRPDLLKAGSIESILQTEKPQMRSIFLQEILFNQRLNCSKVLLASDLQQNLLAFNRDWDVRNKLRQAENTRESGFTIIHPYNKYRTQ